MKKLLKFIAGVISIGAFACGAYYFFKKYVCKETQDDFDDFDDELEDYDSTDSTDSSENREYVSINITADQDEIAEDLAKTEDAVETDDVAETEENE